MHSTAQRVATRYAMEHSSPEALKEYLTEHPGADPAKHVVKEDSTKSEEGHDDESHKDEPKKTVKERMQALSKKVQRLPGSAKKFFEDASHRKEVLSKTGDALKKSPKTYLKKLKETWDHEKYEFKEAGTGIASVMKGGKPTASQKKAIKTVATHLAITAAAAALTSATPALATLSAGKAMIQHIAMKAAAKSLGDLHVLEEMGHIGHGLKHLMHLASDKKASPEEAFSALVLKKVHEELETLSKDDLSDEDLADILELSDDDGGSQEKVASQVALRYRVASRYRAAANEVLASNFQNAIRELKKYKAWIQGFPATLRDAQETSEDLPEGYVWQKEFVDFWKPFGPIERSLMDLSDEITLNLDDTKLWGEASHFLDPPRGARIEDAISKPSFFDDALGNSQIAYPIKKLEGWYKNFFEWVDTSIRGLTAVQAKAKRKGLI